MVLSIQVGIIQEINIIKSMIREAKFYERQKKTLQRNDLYSKNLYRSESKLNNKKGDLFLKEVTNHIKSKEAKQFVATELKFHLKKAKTHGLKRD